MLTAVDPRHAVTFFAEHGWHGFAVLGAVVLVVTGAEALYADMGHFGKRPIRVAWFVLVLPALLLNYFGQGALLLADPAAAANPFFLLAPAWARLPLVGAGHGRRDHRLAGAHLRRASRSPGRPCSSATARGSTSTTRRRTRSARSTCRR